MRILKQFIIFNKWQVFYLVYIVSFMYVYLSVMVGSAYCRCCHPMREGHTPYICCILPKLIYSLNIIHIIRRPQWSRGNVLASISQVHGFKPGWGRWIFQDVKILSTSPPGGTLSWRSRVWDFRLIKESQPEKIGLWAKFNRRIYVLIIP